MRNADGMLVIAPGVFDEILPVYNHKCWVKLNGKWGVIEIENSETEGINEKETEKIEEQNIYTEGRVEMSGVLENVEWQHPNGTPLAARVIRLDSPVTLRITDMGEMIEYKDCERIQLIDVEDSIASSLEGERIKVTGDLSQSGGTVYYWTPYVIWNAVVVPEE